MIHAKNFREVADIWAKTKRQIVKQSTMCAYALILKTHLLPVFGTHTVISDDAVQTFVLTKLADGLARKTVRDIIAVLKAVAKFGRKHGFFPYEEWEIEFPTDIADRKLPVLSRQHQQKLMRHLLDNASSQNIGVLIALCTGMRIGEICGLQWANIDFSRRMISVNRTIGRVYDCSQKATIKIESTPKTKTSRREIPISPLLFSILRAIRHPNPEVYVVGNQLVSKEPRGYRDFFNRLLKRLKIPPIVFHGLRHTFATRCIESQCDYKTVSSLLGHSNVATTLNLYVHPDFGQKKRCIDKMSRHLGITTTG